jgi:RNA polymerase sigma-70 factor, ECF subfamily
MRTSTTENEDIAAAREGDHTAFERIFRRHVVKVRALATWLGAGDDADDMTQDVFALLWRKLGKYDGRAAFATWVHRLAVNTIISAQRTGRARRERTISENDLAPHIHAQCSSTTGSPDERITLEDAIALLPVEFRHVFVLHDIEGYRHDEIGALLGIPPGTSASRLHRSRSLLRTALRGEP